MSSLKYINLDIKKLNYIYLNGIDSIKFFDTKGIYKIYDISKGYTIGIMYISDDNYRNNNEFSSIMDLISKLYKNINHNHGNFIKIIKCL